MERLTARNEYGRAYYPYCFQDDTCEGLGCSGKCDTCQFNESVCDRLAAYEDIGLTPEQLCEVDKLYAEKCKELARYQELTPCYLGSPCEYQNEDIRIDDGWIRCINKLPERNKKVLCWAKSTARGGDCCFVGVCDNGFWFLPTAVGTLSYPTQYEVVAWQPLPEPYQEERD